MVAATLVQVFGESLRVQVELNKMSCFQVQCILSTLTLNNLPF